MHTPVPLAINLGPPVNPVRAALYRSQGTYNLYRYDREKDERGELLLEVAQQSVAGGIAARLVRGELFLWKSDQGYYPTKDPAGESIKDLLLQGPPEDDEYPLRFYSADFAELTYPYKNPCGNRKHPNEILRCTNAEGPWRKPGNWSPYDKQARICRECFKKVGAPGAAAHLANFNRTQNPKNQPRKAAIKTLICCKCGKSCRRFQCRCSHSMCSSCTEKPV